MKIYIYFLFALNATFSFANTSFEILDRYESGYGTQRKSVKLEDLESNHSFDGKFFKIVLKKSNEAIKFNHTEFRLKAATVYYHLTKARKFWINQLNSDFVKKLGKIIVRLEITNLYDDLGHFSNDNKSPQFNNAVTVPAGETPTWVPEHKKDKWGEEIWFRPSKSIHFSEFPSNDMNPLTKILRTLEVPYLFFERGLFIQNILQHIFFPKSVVTPYWQSLIRFSGTWALTKVIVKSSKKMDPLFMETWYYLDTAMVPEVIYHEFAHVALSDYLDLSHSTPVNEGFADYFAAIMSNKKNLYHEVEGYSNSAPKETRNTIPYTHWLESNSQATSDFVLSLLMDIRLKMDLEISDQIILNARKDVSTEFSTINNGLLKALLKSCNKLCTHPSSDKFILYDIFSSRGF